MAISNEINKRAILIDGDLRKPDIHFGKSRSSKGLSNYLLDGTPLSEILIDSEIEKLRIIPAGPSTSKSSELIGSRRMGELLKSLTESGDSTYIIIDSPPIISAAEPISLSKLVDGIILVVKANQTHKEAVLRAVNGLDREKIIGVVLNQIDLKSQRYYGKDYYRNYGK
jgi:non-specific protein-tyrosine kinase